MLVYSLARAWQLARHKRVTVLGVVVVRLRRSTLYGHRCRRESDRIDMETAAVVSHLPARPTTGTGKCGRAARDRAHRWHVTFRGRVRSQHVGVGCRLVTTYS
jgi:hypothetical protein